MRTSPSISNLSKALLQAQKAMGGAAKGAKNPFFKSNYADLPTVMEVVKDPLNDAGIIVLQPATIVDGKNCITTTLIHAESGEFASSDMEIICKSSNNPQDFGAATTYTRRFSLQAMLFIPSLDDDGETAMGRGKSKAAPVYSAPTKTVTEVQAGNADDLAVAAGLKALKEAEKAVTTVTEVQPLKTSNFRKPKTAPTEAPKTESEGW